jgi:HSP20 family protein
MNNENKAEDIFRNLKEGLGEFGQKVNKMVDDLFTGDIGAEAGEVRIRVDIYETKDQLVFELELPGVSKEAVNVHIHDGMLSIKGEKKPTVDAEKVSYISRERRNGSFLRNFALPDHVELGQIKAKFEFGLLTIRLPIIREEEPEEDSSTDIIID